MKNWKTKAVTAVLALSVLVPTAAFAADVIAGKGDAGVKKGIAHHRFLNEEKRQEVDNQILENVGKYTPENLEEWKSALAEQERLMNEMKAKLPAGKQRPQLSEEAKEKLNAIREDVKNGTLTPEQAGEQLKELGIEKFQGKEKFQGRDGFMDRPQLSEEAKEKLNAIREDVKNGTLTPEQAGEQLKELGIEKFQGKEKFQGRDGFMDRPQLSDEAKEKLKAIQEDVKSGKLTPEQARVEMEKLGLNGRKGFDNNNPMVQFREAVEAGDEAKIKELLPQMLQQLQEKNQALSDRLAESNQ